MADSENVHPASVLVVQGQVGGVIASVKIVAEQTVIEAGTTIVEGLDRLFKLFWILNMHYPDGSCNVYKFLESHVYKIKINKMPPTVQELCGCLSECFFFF